MKKFLKTILVLTLCMFIFTSCNNIKSQDINVSTIPNETNTSDIKIEKNDYDIKDEIKKLSSEKNILLPDELLSIPNILMEKSKDKKLAITEFSKESIEFSYPSLLTSKDSAITYSETSVGIMLTSEEICDTLDNPPDFYKKYNKNSKEFFIAQGNQVQKNMVLLNMMYYVDTKRAAFVIAKIPADIDITSDVAEKIYEDFHWEKLI